MTRVPWEQEIWWKVVSHHKLMSISRKLFEWGICSWSFACKSSYHSHGINFWWTKNKCLHTIVGSQKAPHYWLALHLTKHSLDLSACVLPMWTSHFPCPFLVNNCMIDLGFNSGCPMLGESTNPRLLTWCSRNRGFAFSRVLPTLLNKMVMLNDSCAL